MRKYIITTVVTVITLFWVGSIIFPLVAFSSLFIIPMFDYQLAVWVGDNMEVFIVIPIVIAIIVGYITYRSMNNKKEKVNVDQVNNK